MSDTDGWVYLCSAVPWNRSWIPVRHPCPKCGVYLNLEWTCRCYGSEGTIEDVEVECADHGVVGTIRRWWGSDETSFWFKETP